MFYDRACKLHVYALKREPWFFRSTIFRVDILHYLNHVGCAESYNPRVYRQTGMHSSSTAGPYVNSEAAEQANARLRLIRNPAAFMTQDNYMWFVRRFLGQFNALKIASVRQA